MSQEHLNQPISISDPKFAIIGIAQTLSEERLPSTLGGYVQAVSLMQEQSQKVMPEMTLEDAALLVEFEDQMVGVATSMARMALEEGDYGQVMQFSHQLFVFATADIEINLGNQAVLEAVMFHREMFDHLLEQFGGSDPFLVTSAQTMRHDIEQLRAEGDLQYELILIRNTVNAVAWNGTLGEEARELFDPLSMVSI